MRHKDQKPLKRERRVRRSKDTSAPKLVNMKMSVVAVSVALSLGVAYPVFAAGENKEPTTPSSPFSAANLGSTTASGNQATTTSGGTTGGTPVAGSPTPGTVTNPGTDGAAKLPQSGVANEGGAMIYDPSESVIGNAQSCAERTSEIVKENTEIAIETAGTTFDVDDYFKKVRSGGCLVSINDSISLANQITSLSGGTISSVIMSQVKSKIEEASQKMLEKLFNKGCEIMLEASQNVYGSIGELAGKYDIYSNPNYVGDTLLGMIDTGVDNAIFDFDKKVDEIGKDILERDKNRPTVTPGADGGPLVPDGSGNMGGSTGSTSIDEAQKAAAAQTVIDLAQSRNNLVYPLYYRYQRDTNRGNDKRGRKFTHLHSLDSRSPQGSEIDATRVNDAGISPHNDQGQRGDYLNQFACTYIASVSTINNEIRRLVTQYGVQDTTKNAINPHNIATGYWNQVNQHINSAIRNNAECSVPAASSPSTANYSAGGSGNNTSTYSVAPPTTSGGINYGSTSSAPIQAPALRSAVPTGNGPNIGLAAPSTNEATQYMQDKQEEQPTAPASEPAAASSNPFNKMKSFFN